MLSIHKKSNLWLINEDSLLNDFSKALIKYYEIKRTGVSFGLWCLGVVFYWLNMPDISEGVFALQLCFTGAPQLVSCVADLFQYNISLSFFMLFVAYISAIVGAIWEAGILLVLFELALSIEKIVQHSVDNMVTETGMRFQYGRVRFQDHEYVWFKSVQFVSIDDEIIVYPFETVPLNGEIICNAAVVFNQHLSGETTPVLLKKGDLVVSGVVNGHDILKLRVVKDAVNSKYQSLIREAVCLYQNQSNAHCAQQLLGYYFNLIIGVAVLFGCWLYFKQHLSFFADHGVLYRMAGLVTTLSPCAVILSEPVTYMALLSSSLMHNIFIIRKAIMHNVKKCSHVVFDKTGTITDINRCAWHGVLYQQPSSSIVGSECPEYLLKWSLMAISGSSHVVCQSLCKLFNVAHDDSKVRVDKIQEFVGEGMVVEFYDRGAKQDLRYVVGKKDFILRFCSNIDIRSKIICACEAIDNQSGSMLMCMNADTYETVGFLLLNGLKNRTAEMVSELQALGKEITIISGDSFQATESIAKMLNINQFYANLTPEDKLAKITHYKQNGGVVMVGDGVNDILAIAAADIGVIFSKSSTIACLSESVADVVIFSDDIGDTTWLLQQTNRAYNIYYANIIIAGSAIITGVILSSLQILPLWGCVLLHEGSAVTVCLHALTLFFPCRNRRISNAARVSELELRKLK